MARLTLLLLGSLVAHLGHLLVVLVHLHLVGAVRGDDVVCVIGSVAETETLISERVDSLCCRVLQPGALVVQYVQMSKSKDQALRVEGPCVQETWCCAWLVYLRLVSYLCMSEGGGTLRHVGKRSTLERGRRRDSTHGQEVMVECLKGEDSTGNDGQEKDDLKAGDDGVLLTLEGTRCH